MRVEGVPGTVAMTTYWQGGRKRLVIHLVDSVHDEMIRLIVKVPTYRNIEFDLRMARIPTVVSTHRKRYRVGQVIGQRCIEGGYSGISHL